MIKRNLAASVITISIKKLNYSIKIQILSVFWMLEEKKYSKVIHYLQEKYTYRNTNQKKSMTLSDIQYKPKIYILEKTKFLIYNVSKRLRNYILSS